MFPEPWKFLYPKGHGGCRTLFWCYENGLAVELCRGKLDLTHVAVCTTKACDEIIKVENLIQGMLRNLDIRKGVVYAATDINGMSIDAAAAITELQYLTCQNAGWVIVRTFTFFISGTLWSGCLRCRYK